MSNSENKISSEFFSLFENNVELSKDLKKYVNEHIFRYLCVHHKLNITYTEWLKNKK